MAITPPVTIVFFGGGTLSLRWIGCEMAYYPSLEFAVEVDDDPFRGATTFWVTLEEWDRFVGELRACEQTRRGTAYLESTGPGEFVMEFARVDSAGHFELRYQIVRRLRGHRLSGAFDLHMDHFGRCVADVVALTEAISRG